MMRRVIDSFAATHTIVRTSESPSVAYMRSITGTHAAASGRAGSNTIARLNTVAQSSSVRVTPVMLVSSSAGSGFCATAQKLVAS